jgi:hypothetical protein
MVQYNNRRRAPLSTVLILLGFQRFVWPPPLKNLWIAEDKTACAMNVPSTDCPQSNVPFERTAPGAEALQAGD